MKTPVLISFAFVGLLLAACAGGDSGETTTTTSATVDTEDTSTTTTQADETTTTKGSSEAGGTFLGNEECAAVSAAMAQATGGVVPGATTDFDPAEQLEQLEEATAAAPAEIRGDFEVLLVALTEFYQALAEAGIDFNDPATFSSQEALAAFAAAGESLNTEAVLEASENVTAFFEDLCG